MVIIEACTSDWGCEQNTGDKNTSSDPRPPKLKKEESELEKKETEQLVKGAE